MEKEALLYLAEIAEAEHKVRDIRSIAEKAERTQDFEKSLNYYKQYLAMEQQLAEQKRLQEPMHFREVTVRGRKQPVEIAAI